MGWQGLFSGKDGKPPCRMEVVTDANLRIWHLTFGVPGSKNDTTIMQNSPLFNDIRNKSWPPALPEFNFNGFIVKTYYYIADGIYPPFLIFALPHPNPTTRKEKSYGACHSSARKAVKRVFGVLFKHFKYFMYRAVYNPSKKWMLLCEYVAFYTS